MRSVESNRVLHSQESSAILPDCDEYLSFAQLIEEALSSDFSPSDHALTVIRNFEPIPLVKMNRNEVSQILSTLVKNAKESVSDPNIAKPRIEIALGLKTNYVVSISISDNGVGVEPSVLSQIFSNGFSTKPYSSGAGLYEAVTLAASLGGSISAESYGQGKGATFRLTIPLRLDAMVFDREVQCRFD